MAKQTVNYAVLILFASLLGGCNGLTMECGIDAVLHPLPEKTKRYLVHIQVTTDAGDAVTEVGVSCDPTPGSCIDQIPTRWETFVDRDNPLKIPLPDGRQLRLDTPDCDDILVWRSDPDPGAVWPAQVVLVEGGQQVSLHTVDDRAALKAAGVSAVAIRISSIR